MQTYLKHERKQKYGKLKINEKKKMEIGRGLFGCNADISKKTEV